MGIVYRAFDAERRTNVALKTMAQADPGSIYALKREFRSLADVHHQNLVRLYELFHQDGCWFFTMELVEGEQFDIWVRPQARFDAGRVRTGFSQLVDAIQAIHDAGKLHRDLKPSNVLVAEDGELKVLDFGLVTQPRSGEEGRSETDDGLAGTPAYLAPEQAMGAPATAASDAYAIGVMLFEAMAGRTPFAGQAGEILFAKQRMAPTWPSHLVRALPLQLVEICDLLLDREPAARPDLSTLRRHFSDGPPRHRTTPPVGRHPVLARGELIEREAELDQLHDAYRATLAGQAIVLAVSGESGVGKTALCRAFLDELVREDHAVVLRGQCHERESVPFKAFDTLIDELSRYLRRLTPAGIAAVLPRDCSALTTLFPVLGRLQPFAEAPRGPIGDPHQLQRRAFEAFCELLSRMRDRRPLVIHIDDLQWSDRDSLLLLRYLLREAEGLPLLLILGHRAEPGMHDELIDTWDLARSGCDAGLRRIVLEPLSPAASARLATRLLEGRATDALVQRIEQEAHGNPLLIGECARFIADVEHDVSFTFCDVFKSRIAHVSEAARTLLALVALSGRPVPLELALEAAGANQGDVDALRHVRLVRLLNRRDGRALAFFHDQLRERYRIHIPSEQAYAYYTALASACRVRTDMPWELRAEYFEEAGDLEAAASCAVAAADLAFAALAFDHAAQLYTKALALRKLGGEEELALRIRCARALSSAGRTADAAAMYERAAKLAHGEQNLELRQRGAEHWLHSGHAERGIGLLSEVCSEIGMKLPLKPRGHLGTAWSAARAVLAPVAVFSRGTLSPSTRTLQLEVAHTIVSGLEFYRLGGSLQASLEYYVLAQRSGDTRELAWALASLAMAMPARLWREELIARLEDVSSRDGRPELLVLVYGARGLDARRRGALREARSWFSRVLETAHECLGRRWQMLDLVRALDQASAALLGDFAELANTTPGLVEDAFSRGRVWTGASLSGVFGMPAWLTGDDVPGYRRVLDHARSQWGRHARSVELDLPGYLLMRGDIGAAIYSGDLSHGLRVLEAARSNASKSASPSRLTFLSMMCSASALSRARELSLSSSEIEALRGRLNGHAMLRRKPNASRFVPVFDAVLALHEDKIDKAVASLRIALSQFERAHIGMHAAATSRRLGQLIGGFHGHALVERGDAFMHAQGVKNLEAMTELHCPGCVPPT